MPFAIGSSGSAGGNFTASGFSKQLTIPVPNDLTDWTKILDHPHPLKVILLNAGGSIISLKFAESDELESAIAIPPGVVLYETFASVCLLIKSNNQSNVRLTIFTDTLPGVVKPEIPITQLEVMLNELFTGFEVTTVPVSFTLQIDRANLGIPDIDPGVTVDIMLNTIYDNNLITNEPIVLPWDVNVSGYFNSEMYFSSDQYFNNSQIWERTVTITTPGRYFLGSYYNWAGAAYIARLAIQDGKVVFLSEIQL